MQAIWKTDLKMSTFCLSWNYTKKFYQIIPKNYTKDFVFLEIIPKIKNVNIINNIQNNYKIAVPQDFNILKQNIKKKILNNYTKK